MALALVLDCADARPNAAEKAFYRDADPWGFILFARHCEDAEAVRAVCSDLREAVGRHAPIMIDQEGGRVARMKPPAFPAHPASGEIGKLWRRDPEKGLEAARLDGRLLGRLCSDLGVNINAVPMLDVAAADANEAVIGDRSLGDNVNVVVSLGRAIMEGLMEGGALPIIKHMPGHGRATVDSHYGLPAVSASREELREVDFKPFISLKDAPIGMTAHVVYEAFDRDRCGTLSSNIINDIIRGEIGFDGLLLSDDLKMQALGGPVGERVSGALAAGCDIACCCNFSLDDQREAAAAARPLEGRALARAEKALSELPTGVLREDTAADYQRLASLLASSPIA